MDWRVKKENESCPNCCIDDNEDAQMVIKFILEVEERISKIEEKLGLKGTKKKSSEYYNYQ